MMKPFLIESERLRIRPWEPQDEPGFRAMTGDAEMMRYISGGKVWSEERIAEFFARQMRHLASHGCCMGALTERQDGRLVGVCGLQPLGTTADIEVGWWVAKERWGHGLATEAGAAALGFAWNALGAPRVKAVAMADNAASLRVMEKLGLRYERHATGKDLGLVVPDVNVVVYSVDAPSA
jgi:ribosomal-protein-alanine N-acetyltransferase